MKKRTGTFMGLALFASMAGGFVLGYVTKPAPVTATQAIREHTDQYKFIHPLLAVNRADIDTPSPQYVSLAKQVNRFVSDETTKGDIMSASVYLVNYGQSGSFAINQKIPYAPASMLKVVIMVAYLKKSDTDSAILGSRLTYTSNIQKSLESIPFEEPSLLDVGATYTVEDLIERMIVESDNGAMNVLLANIDGEYLDHVYTELGLEGPRDGEIYTISASDYSLFFRVLYNGTYLSNMNSEKALSILSRATFKNGLVAGLPEGTTVAHKFGQRVSGEGDHIDFLELHDCGIVYNPGGPYLLCVMTKGKDLSQLQKTISTISKMVYDVVSTK